MTLAIHKNQKQEITAFTPEQNELIKNMLCKGITDDELQLFAAVCKKSGLDPFMKQIYAVKRNGREGPQMTIQTSVDGYRLIAERTGRYCPGRESTYTYQDGKVFSATSYVKKQTSDGTWHEVSASAYYSEYAPPVTKNGYENPFWRDKSHIMLAKCAETLAIRKCFPNELSGIYTEEEMHQSPNPVIKPVELISNEHAEELQDLLDKCSSENQEKMNAYLQGKGINSFYQLPVECHAAIKKSLKTKSDEHQQFLMDQMGKGD